MSFFSLFSNIFSPPKATVSTSTASCTTTGGGTVSQPATPNILGALFSPISAIGSVVSGVVTTVSNTINDAYTGITQPILGLASNLAAATKDIPIINGLTAGVSTVLGGAQRAVQIVGQHFLMWGTEPAQDIATVTSGVQKLINDLHANPGNATQIIGADINAMIGEISNRSEQFTSSHISHDLELIGLPINTVAKAAGQVLTGVPIANVLAPCTDVPSSIQNFVLENVIHNLIADPIFAKWADFNANTLGSSGMVDMGMGHSSNPSSPMPPCGCDDSATNNMVQVMATMNSGAAVSTVGNVGTTAANQPVLAAAPMLAHA